MAGVLPVTETGAMNLGIDTCTGHILWQLAMYVKALLYTGLRLLHLWQTCSDSCRHHYVYNKMPTKPSLARHKPGYPM